ncbi:hypothetical protein [Tsukamurella sp. NPDC003166]|uniref:hypothetical protein n=1 Tax=Tsukamurella sp. NPDC003166 TaxID=3154444 RepID=UPI0033AE17E6
MSSHGDASVRPPEQGQLTAGQVRFLVGSVAPEVDVRAAAGRPYGRLSPTALQVGTDGSVHLAASPSAVDADAHAAPEVLGGAEPTVRSEVFSLASTSYSLLTGHPPNPYGFATVRRARPDLDPRVDGVLAQATARGPEFRFPTVTAFADALGAALGVSAEPLRPVPPPGSTGQWAAIPAPFAAAGPAPSPAYSPPSGPMPTPAPPAPTGNRFTGFEVSETALSIALLFLVILVGAGCLSLFLIV